MARWDPSQRRIEAPEDVADWEPDAAAADAAAAAATSGDPDHINLKS